MNIPEWCRWSKTEEISHGVCLIFWYNCCLTCKLMKSLPKAMHPPFSINNHISGDLANPFRYYMVYTLFLILWLIQVTFITWEASVCSRIKSWYCTFRLGINRHLGRTYHRTESNCNRDSLNLCFVQLNLRCRSTFLSCTLICKWWCWSFLSHTCMVPASFASLKSLQKKGRTSSAR